MCGVFGVWADNSPEVLSIINNLFIQASYRGTHATGAAFLNKDGVMVCLKDNIPAKDFYRRFDLDCYLRNCSKILLIGHTRYVTSAGIAQPLVDNDYAISLNGVISQAPKEEWIGGFRYRTDNDAEIFLRHAQNNLTQNVTGSFAVVELKRNEVNGVRNGYRPLYRIKNKHGIFFTSTKDMAVRSKLIESDKEIEMIKQGFGTGEHQIESNYGNLECHI